MTCEGGTISGNQAEAGGGLHNNGLLTVTGTLFSNNQATLTGGGLMTDNFPRNGVYAEPERHGATLSGTTFTGNSADMGGAYSPQVP